MLIMRGGPLLFIVGSLGLALACTSSKETGPETTGIHPQPQPNRREASFTAPCTADRCGEIPSTVSAPKCKPLPDECVWTDNTSSSYRECPDSECGAAPGPEVCAVGTTFKGNRCGSENEAACTWTTTCAAPPSTTPCPDPDGCGGKPLIGVICSDGGMGDLACMQFASRCEWQRTCD